MSSRAGSDVDARILNALGDPVRQELLTQLCDGPASASVLSRALELPLATVREQLIVLADNDAVERLDDPSNGDDCRYRATLRPYLDDAHWRLLAPERRQELFRLTLRQISRRIERSILTGGFGHPQTHVSLTRLELDEQGWQELTDLLVGVLEEAMEIHAESAARRLRGASGELVGTNLAVLHFGRADREAQQGHSRPHE